MSDETYLSLVIPAYNEERRLPTSLRLVDEYLADRPFACELVLVDDGSTDATPTIAAGFRPRSENERARVLTHEMNRGKGAAIRTGCLAAEGRFVIFTDADLPVPPLEISRILTALEAGADVAAGSRVAAVGRDAQPFYRRVASHLFSFVRRRLAVSDIRDTQCGLKGFRREAARRLFGAQRLSGWAFDVEILYLAQRFSLRVVQVPIEARHVADSTVRVNLRTALSVLWDVLRIRWMHRHASPGGWGGPSGGR
jgi:dolichyl-phosphate beta-glucosyltransferase